MALILVASVKAFAQAGSIDHAYFFDDNGISNFRNILKTDLIAVIHGDLPLLYEHAINDQISLEGGIGLLLPYYVHDFLPLLLSDNTNISNDKVGYSTWLQARWYPRGEAPELNYWSIQYRKRRLSAGTLTDISFNTGEQRIIGRRAVIDYSIGMGIRIQEGFNYDLDADDLDNFAVILPLFIRFGYLH